MEDKKFDLVLQNGIKYSFGKLLVAAVEAVVVAVAAVVAVVLVVVEVAVVAVMYRKFYNLLNVEQKHFQILNNYLRRWWWTTRWWIWT